MRRGAIANATFWAFLLVVAAAPLPYGAVHLWAYGLLALLVGGVLVLWGLAALVDRAVHPVPFRRYRLPFCLFVPVLAWVALQACPAVPAVLGDPLWAEASAALGTPLPATLSIDPGATLNILLRLATYGAVFWLGMQLCADWRRASVALWTIAIAEFLYAAYGLWAHLTAPGTILMTEKWAYELALTGTFVNRGHYAFYAGMGLLVSFALALRYAQRTGSGAFDNSARFFQSIETLKLPVFLMVANCIVIGTAILLTQSRGGLVFTTIALAAVVVMIVGGGRAGGGGTARHRRSVALILGGLLAGGAVLFAMSGGGLVTRLTDADGTSGGGRADVYALTLDAISAAPFVGHGAGTFPELFNLYRGASFPAISPVFTEAHNVYLEWAAEAGIVAAALYFAALAVVGLTCFAATRRQPHHTVFPAVGAAALLLAGLHSLVDFGTQIPGAAVTLAALAGIGYGRALSGHGEQTGREPAQSGFR